MLEDKLIDLVVKYFSLKYLGFNFVIIGEFKPYFPTSSQGSDYVINHINIIVGRSCRDYC